MQVANSFFTLAKFGNNMRRQFWSTTTSSSSSYVWKSRRICCAVVHGNGRRLLSFYDNNNNSNDFDFSGVGGSNRPPPSSSSRSQTPYVGNPAYTLYKDDFIFKLKVIPPKFRSLPSGCIVEDTREKGRLIFEWTPIEEDTTLEENKKVGLWNLTTRIAMSAEEAGGMLAKLERGDKSVELKRKVKMDENDDTSYFNPNSIDKIFIAKPIDMVCNNDDDYSGTEVTKNDGISLLVDYVDAESGLQGQIPHPPNNDNGRRGPYAIQLTVGEYYVIKSIIQTSIPKLLGWSNMFDKKIDQNIETSHRLGGGGGGGYDGSYHGGRGNPTYHY